MRKLTALILIGVLSPSLGGLFANTIHVSPIGSGDQRTNIQAAFDAALPGDVVQLSNEVFELSGVPGKYYALKMPAGVTLRGPATLRRAGASPAGTTVLFLDGADHAIVTNLTIDGNRDAQVVNEHSHGLIVFQSQGVEITNVNSSNNPGDGVYVYTGTANLRVSDLSVSRNGRNGMTLGGSATDILVKDSRFFRNDVQQFDTEPGGTSSVSDVELTGCTFDAQGVTQVFVISIAGSEINTRTHRYSIHDNIINGGVEVVWADEVQVVNNTGTNPTIFPSVAVYRNCSDVNIEGNRFTMVQDTHDAVGVIYASGTDTGGVNQLRIKNNRLVTVSSRQQNGVRLEGIESAIVVGNDIRGSGRANNGAGVYLRATNPALAFRSAVIVGNSILNSGLAGIFCMGNGTAELTQLVITDNVFDNDGGAMTAATNLDADGTGAAKSVLVSGSVMLNGVH